MLISPMPQPRYVSSESQLDIPLTSAATTSLSYGSAPKVSAGGKRTRAEADEPSGPELRRPVPKRARVERPPSGISVPSSMWTNHSSHSALTSLAADAAPTIPAPGADLDDIDMVSDFERDQLVDDEEMGGSDWAGPSNAQSGPSNAGFYSDPPSFPFPSSSSEVPARLLTLQSPPNFAPTAPPSFSGSLQDAGSLWVSPPPPLREGWSGHTDDHSPDSSDGTPHRREMTLGHLASSRNSEWTHK
jgi:hypothetical protein